MAAVVLFEHQWGWHHLFNLSLYLIVWFFCTTSCSSCSKNQYSWLCALVFALHPTHIESVAWLANHKDVLSLFFVLLSVQVFLKHPKGILLSAPLGLLAYWSKNTAILLPPLLFALSFITQKSKPKSINGGLSGSPWQCSLVWDCLITFNVGSKVSMFADQRADSIGECFPSQHKCGLPILKCSFGQMIWHCIMLSPNQHQSMILQQQLAQP